MSRITFPRTLMASNGNTVKNAEYSFLANVLAARGYLVASIQQDLPIDPPLVTKVGTPYVGRRGVYERGEANILFVARQLKKLHPNADYDQRTLVGHSNGGDASMYFAQQHPELIAARQSVLQRISFFESRKARQMRSHLWGAVQSCQLHARRQLKTL